MNQSFKRRDPVRSPRQVATKAYTLATKKINSDDRRKRHIYHMRERLLIQKTMVSAKSLLNNNSNQVSMHSLCKVALSDPYDDIQTPKSSSEAPEHYPPPPPFLPPVPLETLDCTTAPLSDSSNQSHQPTSTTLVVTPSQGSTSARTPVHVSQGVVHFLQWSLFDLLHCPPFIFWSTLCFFAKNDHQSSNNLEKEYLLLPTHIPISAPRAKSVDNM